MAVGSGPLKSFTITEEVPNGLSVILEGSGVPHGRPRELTAFETGGEVHHKKIFIPGREQPLYQVQQSRQHDLEFRGAFRDHLRAQDISAQDLGWARSMVRDLEEIRRRANMVRIQWAQEKWTGLLIETKFGWESEHDIVYTLRFSIATTQDIVEPSDGALQPVHNPVDIAALVKADLASARAQMAALAVRARALQTIATVLNIMDAAQAAARDLTEAVTTAALVSRAAAGTSARRVDGAGRALQDKLLLLITTISPIHPLAMVPDGDPGDTLAWHTASVTTLVTASECVDRTRSLRAGARAKITKAARVYTVRPGDTLEGIARAELGDASRAGELGVRSDELKPGLLLRLPEAG